MLVERRCERNTKSQYAVPVNVGGNATQSILLPISLLSLQLFVNQAGAAGSIVVQNEGERA